MQSPRLLEVLADIMSEPDLFPLTPTQGDIFREIQATVEAAVSPRHERHAGLLHRATSPPTATSSPPPTSCSSARPASAKRCSPSALPAKSPKPATAPISPTPPTWPPAATAPPSKGGWATTMRFYAGPAALVIDELGYLPLPAEAASALFQVVNQRYLKSSIIMTTNRPVTEWGQVLGDNTVAAALWTGCCTDPSSLTSPETPTASATTKPPPTTSDAPPTQQPLRSTGHQVANFAERDWGPSVSVITDGPARELMPLQPGLVDDVAAGG